MTNAELGNKLLRSVQQMQRGAVARTTKIALPNIDVEKVAKAVEADAGRALPGLRESLRDAKRGKFARAARVELTAAAKARGRGHRL